MVLKARLTTKFQKVINIKKALIVIIIFLNFLLVLSSLNALQLNSETSSSSLCVRETGVFRDLIKNDDTIKNYNVVLKGDAASWATVAPASFVLGPNEEKTLFIYVTPTSSAKPGNYILLVEANSQDKVSSIKHIINIKECYNVKVSAEDNSLESCPNNAVSYTVGIENSGEKIDVFDINIKSDIKDKITLGDNVVSLDVGQAKELKLFVNSPLDAGYYPINLVVTSKSSGASGLAALLLKVNPCYDFSLNVEKETTQSICDRSVLAVPLNLKNKGTIRNSYLVDLDGPVWARLEKADLDLDSGEKSSFNLVFAPDYGVTGNYTIKLTVGPETGDLKSTTEFNIEVRKCHSVDIDFLSSEDNACEGNKNIYTAILKNSGEIKKSFNLSLDAPSWVSFVGETLVFLKGGNELNLSILAVPPVDSEYESYNVKLSAFATDDSSVVANDADDLILNVKKVDECYKPGLETSQNDVVVYFDSNIVVPVDVRNDGSNDVNYKLTLTGNAAEFTNVNPKTLSLKAGNNETVYLYVAPTVGLELGKYDLNVELSLDSGYFLTAKKVYVWVTDGSIMPSVSTAEEFSKWNRFKSWLGRIKERSFLNNFLNFVGLYKWYLVSALTLGILLILIFYYGILGKIVDFFDEDFDEEKPKRKKR